MSKWMEYFLRTLIGFALWFRYKIVVKGLDQLNEKTLFRNSGILFLPNHPAMGVDPLSIIATIWKRFPVRPLIVEYVYYAPVIHSILKKIRSIPVPNNEVSSNSVKKRRSDRALDEVIHGIKIGENFLLYPSGRLKDTGYEFIGGASGVHRIVSANPEINIVLVRMTGFWGSSFSKAYTGKSPPLFPTMWQGVKSSFKNLLFFNPRRLITIEFVPIPEDFPRYGTRMEMNHYLENWYNAPFARPHEKNLGEPLTRVSYSIWRNQLLEPTPPKIDLLDPEINLEKIPETIKNKVKQKLAEVANTPFASIKETMVISSDLGLDSLDMADLVLFLEEEFDVKGVPVVELSTVQRMMGIAARQVVVEDEEVSRHNISSWSKVLPHDKISIAAGDTIPEAFISNAKKYGKQPALGDDRSGILTYSRLLVGSILLSRLIKKLPGTHVGIMLPASVGATLCYYATLLSGKVPVMINWTIGPRHLNSVIEAAGLQRILTSWAFLDRLNNVDLSSVDEELVMLEDMRREISLKDKLKALWLSKKSTTSILEELNVSTINENDHAVILFTSGTENVPKGVPLSHKNLLSNLRSVFATVDLFRDDVLFSVLPPFHSFGITAGVLLGSLSGMKTAYYPNPTNGLAMACGVEKWKASIVFGAPSFLKGMLKSAETKQLQSLRFVVSGAEKAPPDLYVLLKKHGLTEILREGYGITETAPVLTINRPGVEAKGVGQPIIGVEICIVHPETHEVLPIGEEGLILARGPNVFSGYLSRSLTSPFLTVKGVQWYNTGDLGFLDEINRLTISGRLKRFIKVGGEMISLAGIEHALLQAAAEKGWPLSEEGPTLAISAKELEEGKAIIYAFTRFKVSINDLNIALREAGFSNLVRISEVKQLDEIPLMGTGKINYRELESKHLFT